MSNPIPKPRLTVDELIDADLREEIARECSTHGQGRPATAAELYELDAWRDGGASLDELQIRHARRARHAGQIAGRRQRLRRVNTEQRDDLAPTGTRPCVACLAERDRGAGACPHCGAPCTIHAELAAAP